MTLILHNSFGQDAADFNEDTSAIRIGRRIRSARIEKGLSQSELGLKMDLSADRIQKYENGVRKPKIDMLKQFAQILGVETVALTDPVSTNYIGVMYSFFEMEDLYGLEVIKNDENYYLQFGDGFSGTINEYLKAWYEYRETTKICMKDATEDEKQNILIEYHKWEKNFPKSLIDNYGKALQKEMLEKRIAELQEKLDALDI